MNQTTVSLLYTNTWNELSLVGFHLESLPVIQLQPHPYRLASGQAPNGPLSLATQPPFEKSNVLLMYV